MLQIPGKRTRRLLFDAGKPPPVAWMRGAMRLSVAGLAWLFGYPHLAMVFAVFAVMSLVGVVETQVARTFLKVFDAARRLIRAQWGADVASSSRPGKATPAKKT